MVIVFRGYNDLIDVVIELNDEVLYDVGTLKSLETFAENGTISTNTSDIDMVFKAEATGNIAYSVVDSSNPCSDPVPVSGGDTLSPGKSYICKPSILRPCPWLTQAHCFFLFTGEAAAIAIGGFIAAAVVVGAVAGLVAAGY